MSFDVYAHQFTGEAAVGHTCWNCGVQYAIPESLSRAWTERRKYELTCPACGRGAIPAGKSEADNARDDALRWQHKAEQARAAADYAESERARAERQASARKGQVTKIKNRIARGVCPVCNRSFLNLARHMGGKHPHFAEAES